MALLSSTRIIIDGNTLNTFNTFSLKQDLGAHHDLELSCYVHNLEKSTGLSAFDELLGVAIAIEITPLVNLSYYKQLQFKGIVSGFQQKQGMYSGEGDVITILAKSPTILADDGPHYTSYNEKSIVDVITQNFGDYDASKLKVNTGNSNLQDPVLYTVQNNESCFEFAKNLASRHGEWLYYDGMELMFGLDTSTETVALKLGRDLKSFSTSMIPAAQKFNYYTNDYLTDTLHEKDAASINGNTPESLNKISSKAEDIYAKETHVWLNALDDTGAKSKLDSKAKAQKEAVLGNQLIVNGVSDNPGVSLAKEIKINGVTYRVIQVEHQYNLNGEYQNIFKAISSQSQAYPKTNIMKFPESHSQTATVKENNDPEGLSRIKVQFRWQVKQGLTTPWIRLLSPHGGSEKGFHFVPEVGEEVLIGFEGGNAERPYFMGSLYNSKAKAESWKTEKNDIKAIKTRSGHTLTFSDESGKESITITDSSGNSILLDTVKSELTISAPKKININSEEININGSKTVNIDGTNKVKVTSKEVLNHGSSKVTVKSDTKAEVKAPSTLVQGDQQLKVKSTGITDIDGTTMTNVKGGMLNLNC